jgi:hypothetical protein
MDSKDILQTANEINGCYQQACRHPRYNRESFMGIMAREYSEFYTKYSSIFNMACSEKYNADMLRYLLNQANKVKTGKIDQNTADIKVGQLLVDNIVKPQLDKSGIKPDKK